VAGNGGVTDKWLDFHPPASQLGCLPP